MRKIVSESRLAAKCRACPYVDTCDHKRMEAMACMVMDAHDGRTAEDMAMPSAETMAAPIMRDLRTVTIHLDSETTVQVSVEDISKELYKHLSLEHIMGYPGA